MVSSLEAEMCVDGLVLGLSTVFEGVSPALPLWGSAAPVVSEWELT